MIARKIGRRDISDNVEIANDHDGDLVAINHRLLEELSDLRSIVSEAVLVTTAFRLKDERGLVHTLRQLAIAIDRLERQRASD